jgi:hypothetical protein
MIKPKWLFGEGIAIIISISSLTIAQPRSTARHMEKIADSLAFSIASDATLLSVISCSIDSSLNCWSSDLDTTGRSSVWSYIYSSYDSATDYFFVAESNQVRLSYTCHVGELVGVGPIDTLSIDSDSALSIAGRGGGSNIMKRFPTCVIRAGLSGHFSPEYIGSLWWIEYRCSDSTRAIVINAVTGSLLTSVGQTDKPVLPIYPQLHQNYPNPFNPTSTIHFELPKESHVILKVYNLLGQELLTLVDEKRIAGTYNVQVNGAQLASGVYFYRLIAGNFVQTRKMLVVK